MRKMHHLFGVNRPSVEAKRIIRSEKVKTEKMSSSLFVNVP